MLFQFNNQTIPMLCTIWCFRISRTNTLRNDNCIAYVHMEQTKRNVQTQCLLYIFMKDFPEHNFILKNLFKIICGRVTKHYRFITNTTIASWILYPMYVRCSFNKLGSKKRLITPDYSLWLWTHIVKHCYFVHVISIHST